MQSQTSSPLNRERRALPVRRELVERIFRFSTTRIVPCARCSTSPDHNGLTFVNVASSAGLLSLAGAHQKPSICGAR